MTPATENSPLFPRSKIVYSIEEVLENLPIARSTLYNMMRAGTLKAHKIGKRVVIKGDEIEKFLKRLRKRPRVGQ